ncbi:MAG: sugar nucleotide-binding protein [Candidatus Micrarchaeales archaeon]|jgi:dTDP-4-dehydrorhamnose reductase
MKLLIIGSSSYLGARVYEDLKKDFEILGTYHRQRLFAEQVKFDLSDPIGISAILEKSKPEAIVHVGGLPFKQCKENEKLAYEINVRATEQIVKEANKAGAKIIYMSTIMAENALDVYGKTKLEAEKCVANTDAGYLILRGALAVGQSPNTTAEKYYNKLLRNVIEKTPPVYDNSALTQVTWLGSVSEIIRLSVEKDIFNQTVPVITEEKKTRFEIANDLLKEFGILCKPSIGTGYVEEFYYTTQKLMELELPVYSYNQIVRRTIDEMRSWLESARLVKGQKEV